MSCPHLCIFPCGSESNSKLFPSILLQVRALRPIPAGGECTISYLSPPLQVGHAHSSIGSKHVLILCLTRASCPNRASGGGGPICLSSTSLHFRFWSHRRFQRAVRHLPSQLSQLYQLPRPYQLPQPYQLPIQTALCGRLQHIMWHWKVVWSWEALTSRRI